MLHACIRFVFAFCAVALVASAAQAQSRTFNCGKEGRVTVTVTGPQTVQAGPIQGEYIQFTQSPDEKWYFLRHDYGLRVARNQQSITVEVPDYGSYRCNAVYASAPKPPKPSGAISFPRSAKSWGGIVRSGPRQNSRKVASLREGELITIVSQSNAAWFQDRPWFKIRFRGGRTGYHWGGIICSIGTQVPGTYQTCD